MGVRLVVAGVLFVCVGIAGCSGPDDHCGAGAEFEESHQLARAAESYAQAERAKEGDCAGDGADRVAKRQGEALRSVARAEAAEQAGDRAGALRSYQEALATDRGNASATLGVARLTTRPTSVDPVWMPAKRLADEGYTDAARAEVVAVLRKHPEQTVPSALAGLQPTPDASRPAAPTGRPSVVDVAADRPAAWGLSENVLLGLLCVAVAGFALVTRRQRTAVAAASRSLEIATRTADRANEGQVRVGADLESFRDHVDRRLDELRKLVAHSVAQSDGHTDGGLSDVRSEVHRDLTALRADLAAVFRAELSEVRGQLDRSDRQLAALYRERRSRPGLTRERYVAGSEEDR